VLLGLVCLLAFFWNLGANGLFDLDEALYAEAAREMALTGDYVVPRVNAKPFFEKPPLIYWEAAALFSLFGRSEITARLPSALAATTLTFLVFWFGTRLFGRRAGFLAAVFLAFSPVFFGSARQLTTDVTLTLCISAAVVMFHRSRWTAGGASGGWAVGFWAACGWGVLAKGIPGILFPLLIAVVTVAVTERFQWRAVARGLWSLRPLVGVPVFLAIVLPWHLAAWNAAGSVFVDEYIVRQHLQRFRGGDTSHLAPFWFFVPGFLLGAFPWSLFVPAALRRPKQDTPRAEPSDEAAFGRTLLIVWTAAVFLFFSASGSKLISYILPMYPAAALLAGAWCSRAIDRAGARRALLAGGAVAFLLSALLFGVLLFRDAVIRLIDERTGRPVRMDDAPPELLAWAMHLFGAAALATGAFLLLTALDRRKAAFGALLAGMALFIGVAVTEGLAVLDRSLLAPLHRASVEAAQTAGERDARLLLITGSARRPSALFVMPDEMLRSRSGESRVTEFTDLAKAVAALEHRRPWVVVIDERRAPALVEAVPEAEILRRTRGWTTLWVGPVPPSSLPQEPEKAPNGL
jgi:4-amino-4-deoxy-L-arabinose transferase-like glycosyltransferase